VRQVGLVPYSQGLADCSGGGINPAAGFRIPKFGHILAPGVTTIGGIAKRTRPRDSAHQVGLVRHSQGLFNCSGVISKGGTTLAAGF